MSDEADNPDSAAEGTETQKFSVDNIIDERGVPLGNVLKEVTRKLGRINDMNAKLDMLLQNNVTTAGKSADNAALSAASQIDSETKRYIDARLLEGKKEAVEKAQKSALDEVLKTFPELNQNADEFDTDFFNLAVEYEKSIDSLDPARTMKAAKLAALDLGKVEKITKARVLQDDARRSRILSEGASPKESRKGSKDLKMNGDAIQRLLKVDPKKVAKFAQEGN